MSNLNKRFFYISTASVGLLLTLVLYSVPAYAVNPTPTWSYPYYFVGQGGIITFDDTATPHLSNCVIGGQPATTPVTVTNLDIAGDTITITLSDNGNCLFKSPYVMFTTNPSDTTTPNLQVTPPIAPPGSSQRVQATVLGQTSATILIKSDDAPSNWPSLSTTNQPAKKKILTCITPDKSTTGDGICDSWKDQTAHSGWLQIPITDPTTGTSGTYRWPCGSNPLASSDPCPDINHKDVYIEADMLPNQGPDPVAITDLKNAFANAPSTIVLHFIRDDTTQYYKSDINLPSPGAPITVTSTFDKLKTNYFGTYSERTTPAFMNGDQNKPLSICPSGTTTSQCISDMLTAKRQVFHYMLFTHWQYGNHPSSGSSELPGNDIDISLGSFAGGIGSVDQQEGTIMHELGHNLGLYHGGSYPSLNPADDSYANCKPNYPSVMSYARQFSVLDTGRYLNYSSGTNAPLVENNLIMEMGAGAPPVVHPGGLKVIFGINDPNTPSSLGINTANPNIKMAAANGKVDWDNDGDSTTLPETTNLNSYTWPASHNINNLGFTGCNVYAGQTGAITTLSDNNDWNSLVYNQTLSTAFYDGAPIVTSGHVEKYPPDSRGYVDEATVKLIHDADKGDHSAIKRLRDHPPSFVQETGTSIDALRVMLSYRVAQLGSVIDKAKGDEVLSGSDADKLHGNVNAIANDLIMKDSLYDAKLQIHKIKTNITNAYVPHGKNSMINTNPSTNYPSTSNATAMIDDVLLALEKQSAPGLPLSNTVLPPPVKWTNYNLNPANAKCNYDFVLLQKNETDTLQYVCVMPDHVDKITQNPIWIPYKPT